MLIGRIRELQETQHHPFTQADLDQGPRFVRCTNPSNGTPRTHKDRPYQVRVSTEMTGPEGRRYLYKLDGFESGVQSPKDFAATSFIRYVPMVGDLVTLANGAKEPALISKITGVGRGDLTVFHLHAYDKESREWRYGGNYSNVDLTPALDLAVDKDILAAFGMHDDVSQVVVTDTNYLGLSGTNTTVDDQAPTDRAFNVRVESLRRAYSDSLQTAAASAKQYSALTGKMLDSAEAVIAASVRVIELEREAAKAAQEQVKR